jgi:hypothetical protein
MRQITNDELWVRKIVDYLKVVDCSPEVESRLVAAGFLNDKGILTHRGRSFLKENCTDPDVLKRL